MRKLVVCNIISLDGYYEGAGRNVMALPFDEAFDEYCAVRLRAADTLLEGRTTFEQSRDYWPPVADNPGARPVEREVSRLLNAVDKVVISDSLTPERIAPWTNTRIIKRADVDEQITKLKRQPGKEIIVFGSHRLWNGLLSGGLVDELHLLIGPALLGGGTPVFEGSAPVALRLLDSHTLENSQLVLVRYSAHV